MSSRNLLFLQVFFVFNSCIVPKESRLFKKTRNTYTDSPVVLEAYADSPFSGTFITLRANHTFEHSSSGILKSYQAGDWSHKGDSVFLKYRNVQMIETETKVLLIDRKTQKLRFEKNDTVPWGGLKIMVNSL